MANSKFFLFLMIVFIAFTSTGVVSAQNTYGPSFSSKDQSITATGQINNHYENLLVSQNLGYVPEFDSFDTTKQIDAIHQTQGLSLNSMVQFTAVQSTGIRNAAQKYGINPRVLLALIEAISQSITSPTSLSMTSAAGYSANEASDFSNQVSLLAEKLSQYYSFFDLNPDPNQTITFPDGQTVDLSSDQLDSASLAVLKTLAEVSTVESLPTQAASFSQLYSAWFGNPLIEPSFVADVAMPSDARLPFDGKAKFTSGPHQTSYITNPDGTKKINFCAETNILDESGVDFSTGSNFDVFSIAEGTLIYMGGSLSGAGGYGNIVIIEHTTGLQTMYAHLSTFSTELKAKNNGDKLPKGFKVGISGGTNNTSTPFAVHLHLDLRVGSTSAHLGTRIPWDGKSLGGWVINSMHTSIDSTKGRDYQGTATKAGLLTTQKTGIQFCKASDIALITTDASGFVYADTGDTSQIENLSAPTPPVVTPPATLTGSRRFSIPILWYYLISTGDERIRNIYLDGNLIIVKPACAKAMWVSAGWHELSYEYDNNGSGQPSVPSQPWPFISPACAASTIETPPSQTNPPSTPVPFSDFAIMTADITIPDGSIISAGQTLTKTWRMKNTGTATWGAGYKLTFVNGEQMGAPLTIDTGNVAPNAMVDLSVALTGPSSAGEHIGYFQLRNPQGTYYGPRIWVKINVQVNNASSGNITTFDINPASPSQASQVHLVGRISSFTDFRSMRFVIGNDIREMSNFRQIGGQMEISTDWNTASLPRGNYAIALEVAKMGDTSWASPERRVQTYTLTGTPASTNRPPDRPILLSPYNWYLKDAGGASSTVQLCVQPATDPDGNTVMYYFEVNGGAIISGLVSSCWSYTFSPGTYSWRVKSSDGSLYSDWSNDTWNFTVAKGGVYIGGMSLYSPNSSDTHICVPITYDGIIAPDAYAWINLAADGSQNGEWKLLDHYGPNASPDCTSANVHGWWIRSQDYDTGTHAIKVSGVKRDTGANATGIFSYSIAYMRPPAPQPVAPSSNNNNGTWWTSPMVNFQWSAVSRVSSYTLRASTNSNPWADASPVLNVDLGPGVTSYNYNFTQDYSALYWSVRASNSAGSADTGGGIWFGIDRVAPSCQIQTLPSISYENIFKVTWLGVDNSAGIRSYDIQYRDSGRAEWIDWQTAVPASKTYDSFNGQPGHTYQFHCRSTDNAGNMSSYPAGYDTALKIDPSARPPEPWWNNAYAIKRSITIQNNMLGATLPANYPVNVRLTAGTAPSSLDIFNGSQSATKCNDLRIVYNNTTELNRFVKKCTSDEIDIWFRTSSAITGGGTDVTYQIYLGNASASNPPADASQIWYPYRESDTTNLYLFQEGSGTTAYDYSIYGRNCSINPAAVSWTTGKWGNALHFGRYNNGSTVSLTCGDQYPISALTAEFWWKPDVNNNNTDGRLAGQLGPSGQLSWLFSLESDHLKFERWCNGGSQQARGNINIRQQPYYGQWNYLAVTFDGGSQVKFYVNGNLDNAVTLGNSCNQSFNVPLEIGSVEGSGQGEYTLGAFRMSNSVKTSFAPGAMTSVSNEPAAFIGSAISPTVGGTPDLYIVSLNAYPAPTGGILIQAVVKNQGTRDTLNGFFTDLYVDHIPTGSGDLTGSYKFWVNDPIAPGATATLTTIIDTVPVLAALGAVVPGEEKTTTLYAQVDSTGAVSESTKTNNISLGAQVCVANTDAYENDGSASLATSITLGQIQLHNFTSQSDQDWVSFTATAGQKYILKTSNLGPSADTYLYLYGQDGVTLLDSNDDDGTTLASQIEWVAPSTGTYYVLVRDWDPNISGCGTGYTLSVGYTNFPVYLPSVVR